MNIYAYINVHDHVDAQELHRKRLLHCISQPPACSSSHPRMWCYQQQERVQMFPPPLFSVAGGQKLDSHRQTLSSGVSQTLKLHRNRWGNFKLHRRDSLSVGNVFPPDRYLHWVLSNSNKNSSSICNTSLAEPEDFSRTSHWLQGCSHRVQLLFLRK